MIRGYAMACRLERPAYVRAVSIDVTYLAAGILTHRTCCLNQLRTVFYRILCRECVAGCLAVALSCPAAAAAAKLADRELQPRSCIAGAYGVIRRLGTSSVQLRKPWSSARERRAHERIVRPSCYIALKLDVALVACALLRCCEARRRSLGATRLICSEDEAGGSHQRDAYGTRGVVLRRIPAFKCVRCLWGAGAPLPGLFVGVLHAGLLF